METGEYVDNVTGSFIIAFNEEELTIDNVEKKSVLAEEENYNGEEIQTSLIYYNTSEEEQGSDFVTFIIEENVFVYGQQLTFGGSNVTGENASVLINDELNTEDLNDGSSMDVSNIFIDGNVNLDGGSASLGSQSEPGEIHINGNLNLWSGGRNIYGEVYVAGNFRLKDANINGNIYVDGNVELDWTPTINGDAKIFYTGDLTYPDWYEQNILNKCIASDDPQFPDPFPTVEIPDLEIPELKPDNWYIDKGYVSEGTLNSNIKIFADSYISSGWKPTANNIIIVAKQGDISLTGLGGSGVTGILYAPNGSVTFEGSFFEGVVISKNGFFVNSGGTTVTFKNMEEYIDNPDDYPF
jgi:formylmethanofuran dehydrogenase subunit C